jgi:Mce-associated membrane protein
VTTDDKADEAEDRELVESDGAEVSAEDTDSTGDEPAEAADAEAGEAGAADTSRPSVVRQALRGARSQLAAILLAAALVASAGVAAWLYFQQYRPDQQTNDAAAQVALDAAKTGTVAMLSYSPESLDKDFTNAKSHLTGDFLSYYTQFTEQIVTPAAKQKAVKTSAAVVRAAVSELHPDSAMVLVFINQNTTSKENPDGAFAASSVKVGMKKIDGTWLISSFDPV